MRTDISKRYAMSSAENTTKRNTKQRAIIMECLKYNTNTHITADDLYDILKSNDNKVGKATIYRYLAQLEKAGDVKKYDFLGKKGACYRYLCEASECREHYHMMCDMCGEVKHIENDKLQKVLSAIQKEQNFKINDVKTVFYGTCERCGNKN